MRIIDNVRYRLIDVLESKIDSETRVYYVGSFFTSYALFNLITFLRKSKSIQFLLNTEGVEDSKYLSNKGDEEKLYFVVESKGSKSELDLRPKELSKIECGKRHFESLNSTLKVGTNLSDIIQ